MRTPMLTLPRLHFLICVALLGQLSPAGAFSQSTDAPHREILPGIATTRPLLGAPYELQGKRIVFLNWHYVQPGDLDWRDSEGQSVYVEGDSGLFDARHVGIN